MHYQQSFNDMADKVVNCEEFSQKLQVCQEIFFTASDGAVLAKHLPEALSKAKGCLKPGNGMRSMLAAKCGDGSMGAYVDKAGEKYVSAMFICAATRAAMSYASDNNETEEYTEKLYTASLQALQNCTDHSQKRSTGRLRPVL